MNIQLAIQGGGAKIWALLATMQAIQDLESDGILRVTRIAGSSAGAIAGCLFASGIPIAEIRKYLRSEAGQQLASQFSKPFLPLALWKILRGKPVWNSNSLGEQLSSIFGKQHIHKLEDFQERERSVLVIVTDLREGKAYPHQGGVSVGHALLDSAGIPFCFRTWNHGHYVDGGLCENLPLEMLIAQKHEYGPVVGISFEPTWKEPPTSLGSFALALLDTAINNSVE